MSELVIPFTPLLKIISVCLLSVEEITLRLRSFWRRLYSSIRRGLDLHIPTMRTL